MDRSVTIPLFLLTLFIKAIDATVMCPYLAVWDAHSKMFCDDPAHYHCLENQSGDLTEACLKPVYIDSGHYPVLSIDLTFITPVECPPTHYQPGGQMSNRYKHITCMYPKSLCDDHGEEKCDDGSSTMDRMCRCDYTKGYRSQTYLFSNPKNLSCYQPKSEEEGCAMLGCPEGQELNPAYFCVKKCPSGSYRRKHEFNCVKKNTAPISTVKPMTETSTTVEVTHRPDVNGDVTGSENKEGISVVAAIGSSVLVVFITVPLSLVLYHYCRKSQRRGNFDSKGGDKSGKDIKMKERPSQVIIKADTYIGTMVIEEVQNLVTGDKNTILINEQSSND